MASRSRKIWFLPLMLLVLLPLQHAGCTAAEDVVTDLDSLCETVQCPSDCPADSYMPSKAEYFAGETNGLFGHDVRDDEAATEEPPTGERRERRSIAMNNHPHESIRIIPSAHVFVHQNQLQAARAPRHHLWKRAVPYAQDATDELLDGGAAPGSGVDLHELCCPKCVCRVCREASCPPNYIPIDEGDGTTAREPGSCCPHVLCQAKPVCRSENFPDQLFADGEQWNDSPCSSCKCVNGRPSCLISTCRPLNCKNTHQIPGECCPVCDEEGSMFCPGQVNCGLNCRFGFKSEGACYLCECSRQPNATITPTTANTPDTTTTTTTSSSTEPASSTEPTHVPTTSDELVVELELETSNRYRPEPEPTSMDPVNQPVDTVSFYMSTLYMIISSLFVSLGLAAVIYGWKLAQTRHRGKYSTVPVTASTAPTTPVPSVQLIATTPTMTANSFA